MSLKKLIPRPIRKLLRPIVDRVPLTVELRPLKSEWPGDKHRFHYQERYVNFNIRPTDRVLDIGSGSDPFPYATHTADRFLNPTEHRYGPLVKSRGLVGADIHGLPFRDKSFDFVYCAHILEHVEDPLQACAEIMRVGKRGYIETPTMGEDILFAWTSDIHKWHVVGCARTLCFFEYTPRQSEGIRSTAWVDVIQGQRVHPLQQAFYENQDIFNVMFTWDESFTVFVFRNDGTIESLNAGVVRSKTIGDPQPS